MAIKTLGNVKGAVRTLLGDTEVSGGQWFTDAAAIMTDAIGLVWNELYQALLTYSPSYLNDDAYFQLPSYTDRVDPSSVLLGVPGGIGSIRFIRERKLTTLLTITTIVNSGGIITVTTGSVHNLTIGKRVEIYNAQGMTEDINDSYSITPGISTQFILNGASTTGSHTAGTGFALYSTEQWSDALIPYREMESFPLDAQSTLDRFAFIRGFLRFPQVTSAREIWLQYQLSGEAPTDNASSILIDAAYPYLCFAVAEICAESKASLRGKKASDMANKAEIAMRRLRRNLVWSTQRDNEPIVPPPYNAPVATEDELLLG